MGKGDLFWGGEWGLFCGEGNYLIGEGGLFGGGGEPIWWGRGFFLVGNGGPIRLGRGTT